jgi:quinol monooxygenase YgiN
MEERFDDTVRRHTGGVLTHEEEAMHARLSIFQGRPDEVEAMRRIWEEEILPAARQQHGFAGATAIIDPVSAQGYSITLWESPEAERATMTSDYMRGLLAKIAALVVAPVQQSSYDVLAHDPGPQAS